MGDGYFEVGARSIIDGVRLSQAAMRVVLALGGHKKTPCASRLVNR